MRVCNDGIWNELHMGGWGVYASVAMELLLKAVMDLALEIVSGV